MIQLTGTVKGEAQLDRALSRIISASNDLRIPFEFIGEDFRRIESDQFDGEGYGWDALSPRYAARKLALYGELPILHRTGALREAMTIRGAPGNITEVFETEARFGTDIEYGSYHQTGTSRMPQREVIRLREEDKREMTRTMQRYMIATGQAAGFAVIAE